MNERICFVIPYLADGGAERVVSILANQLADFNYDVSIILFHHAKNEYQISSKVKVYLTVDGQRESYCGLSYFEKLNRLRKNLKIIQPDYLIPFLPHVAIHTALAGMGLKYKTIQTVRIAPQIAPQSAGFRFIRNLQVACSYCTFVQNEEQKAYFPRLIQKKIVVLPNPVSDEMIGVHRTSHGMQRFISVGRLTAQKNFTMAIDAVIGMRDCGYPVTLDIYGEGNKKDELQEHIDRMQAQDYIHLHGRAQNIRQEYENADAFLLTSDYEGMPNALLEAMATGLPCIATDCPTGPSTLIGKERGILIPMHDTDSLLGAMKTLIEHPEQARKMGDLAKAFVKEQYSAQTISKRFIKEVLRQEYKQ